MNIDQILQKFGLKYEDLSAAERQTLQGWMAALESNQLTLQMVKSFVSSLRDNIEDELAKADNGTKQDIFLKARLRNIMLIEAFMSSPDKAKQRIESMLSGMVGTNIKQEVKENV